MGCLSTPMIKLNRHKEGWGKIILYGAPVLPSDVFIGLHRKSSGSRITWMCDVQ